MSKTCLEYQEVSSLFSPGCAALFHLALWAPFTSFQVITLLSRARAARSIAEVSEDGSEILNSDLSAECNELYSLLEDWGEPMKDDIPPRIRAGNSIYKTGFQVRIAADSANSSSTNS